MKKIFAFLILFIGFNTSYSQRLLDRFSLLNPLFNEEKNLAQDELRWMNSINGWGELGKYVILKDNDHAWHTNMGMFFEIFRIGANTSLSFLSGIEFISDSHNDINFNPRAVLWEEAFIFSKKINRNYLQIGYFHRCKHDVDNLYVRTERSLIYGSIHGKFSMPVKFFQDDFSLVTFRAELYTIRQDGRSPDGYKNVLPDYESLIGTAGAQLNIKKNISNLFGFYFASFSNVNVFGGKKSFLDRFESIDKLTFSGGASAGFYIFGDAYFSLGINYEYLPDTEIRLVPHSAHLISAGIKINPKEIL
jgi:hypothetical protein